MKLIIEEHPYKASKVGYLMKEVNALETSDGNISVNYVGYFYSKEVADCIFFLPKVVMDNHEKVFKKYAPEDLIDLTEALASGKIKKEEYDFIYNFSVWIYRALCEFNRLNEGSTIVYSKNIPSIGISGSNVYNTFLDILLSLIRFNNENQNYFMFLLKNVHSGYNKINWNKTISTQQALIQNNDPIYLKMINKKRQINFDEELLIIFFSILHHIKKKYGFHAHINYNYELIDEEHFENYLDGYGCIRMLRIKYKYFTDKQLQLWNLCYAFFLQMERIYANSQQSDYLLAKNFNIVFEAIIDELLSDKDLEESRLKKQEDGKIVDHIYAYDGIINNNSQIYYIGDSKYYKIGNKPAPYSVFKQYTYARNIIQYNLNLFFAGKSQNLYQDSDTEGYNITPNFFIRARLNDDFSYEDNRLSYINAEEPSKHFENRLFDRDTLLLQHYDVNFLFVLSLYAGGNDSLKDEFKIDARKNFRNHIIKYLEDRYQFFSLQQKPQVGVTLQDSINRHFRKIIGKTFRPYNETELLYLSFELNEKFYDENMALLSDLSEDFYIRPYRLGSDPRSATSKYIQAEKTIINTNNKTQKNIYHFQDFMQETFLIGGFRSVEKNQLDWILKNKSYNVRYSNMRAGSVGRIKAVAVAARFLILYDIYDEERKIYKIFRLESHNIKTENQMAKLGYNSPNGSYLVYSLAQEIQFEPIDLNTLLEYARISEMERLRNINSITDHWEEEWKGSPIYFSGEEINRLKQYSK